MAPNACVVVALIIKIMDGAKSKPDRKRKKMDKQLVKDLLNELEFSLKALNDDLKETIDRVERLTQAIEE